MGFQVVCVVVLRVFAGHPLSPRQALDLKAVVFQKEQELRLRQAEVEETRKVC